MSNYLSKTKHAWAVGLGCLLILVSAHAGSTPDQAQRAADRKAVFDTNLSAFLTKDYTNGEKLLLSDNQAKADTLSWSLESARKLTQMAVTLRAHYDYKGARKLAARALEILQATDGTSMAAKETAKRQSQRYVASGQIHEDLLNDLASAKTDYRHALTLDSGSLQAQTALARIAEIERQHLLIGARGGTK